MNRDESAEICWRDLAARFGERTLWRGLTGCLTRSERVWVKGPSGSGKTTFLKILLGLQAPAEGSVECVNDIRGLAAYVPQDPDFGDAPSAKVWLDQVFAFRRNRSARPTEAKVREVCRRLLLSETTLTTGAQRLSGGEKQRLALAAALLLPREVLILDEPFAALDEACARAAASAIVESGRAVLYASHQAAARADFATREIEL